MYRHFFLNSKNFLNRLEEYYNKYGQLIVAYDFDDTIYDCRKYGRDYEELVSLIKRLRDFAYLIVFTARPESEYDLVKNFLRENEIPYDSINEDAPQIPIERRCRKVYYHILLDDKAGLIMPYEALLEFLKRHEKRDS